MKNLKENYKNYLDDCEEQGIAEILNINEYESVMDQMQEEAESEMIAREYFE